MNNFFHSVKKWCLLGVLVLLLFVFFYFHLYQYLTFDTVKKYHASAQTWTMAHYKSAVCLYVLTFVALIACAIPCATLFTLIGGFLFGVIALIYAVFATTLGGVILFLAVRTAVGARIAANSTGWIKTMEAGFQKNAFNYLLMLRLVPIFPCWISNVSAGALNVPLKTFISATVLGILPSTFIYIMAGRGLGKFFTAKQTPNLSLILTPSIFFPLLGLAILSLFPVFYKCAKKRNQDK